MGDQVSSDKDPIAQESLDPIALGLSASQKVVLNTLSEEEDEERAPLFEQEQMDTDFDLNLSPDEHVGVASASSPSELILQFYDLMDQMVSTLSPLLVSVEETSHTVFNILGATSRNRPSLSVLVGPSQPAKTV